MQAMRAYAPAARVVPPSTHRFKRRTRGGSLDSTIFSDEVALPTLNSFQRKEREVREHIKFFNSLLYHSDPVTRMTFKLFSILCFLSWARRD